MTKRKEAKAHINIRIPKEVLEFYKQYPNFSSKMREVLAEYMVKTQTEAATENGV